MNTPRISSMTGKVYQWTWTVLEEEMYHLIQLCARMGFQLLEVLSKVLEQVQAWRLAYIATRHNLFPSSQFGGIPGRSAKDTLLCTIHDIETAWNHKQKASILTFDITGFFDTIPHSHLLNTLHSYHIPLPITRWVHSFLQE